MKNTGHGPATKAVPTRAATRSAYSLKQLSGLLQYLRGGERSGESIKVTSLSLRPTPDDHCKKTELI